MIHGMTADMAARPDDCGCHIWYDVIEIGEWFHSLDFTVPRCTFSIYTYPDPGDPQVVAIDTVTSDLILTDPDQVTPYDRLYERLWDAALPPAESLDLLTRAAASLAEA